MRCRAWLPGDVRVRRPCHCSLHSQAPVPAQQAEQRAEQQQQLAVPPAGPVPAWVQRARQGPDVTQALIAAAADCALVPLPDSWRQQRQRESGPAPVQGWLAYRVAGQLPQSAACRHAADVLQVGAAAAAAAAAAADADSGVEPERRQAGARTTGAGPQQQQQQQVDLSQLAARLLAGLTLQGEPHADLAERSSHFFNHRSSALQRKLKRHLAPVLGGSAAGGRRPPVPSGKRPSRLRPAGSLDATAGGGGEAGPANEAAAAAAAAARPFTGVRPTAEGRFTATFSLRSEQFWLGTYPTAEAVSWGCICL